MWFRTTPEFGLSLYSLLFKAIPKSYRCRSAWVWFWHILWNLTSVYLTAFQKHSNPLLSHLSPSHQTGPVKWIWTLIPLYSANPSLMITLWHFFVKRMAPWTGLTRQIPPKIPGRTSLLNYLTSTLRPPGRKIRVMNLQQCPGQHQPQLRRKTPSETSWAPGGNLGATWPETTRRRRTPLRVLLPQCQGWWALQSSKCLQAPSLPLLQNQVRIIKYLTLLLGENQLSFCSKWFLPRTVTVSYLSLSQCSISISISKTTFGWHTLSSLCYLSLSIFHKASFRPVFKGLFLKWHLFFFLLSRLPLFFIQKEKWGWCIESLIFYADSCLWGCCHEQKNTWVLRMQLSMNMLFAANR